MHTKQKSPRDRLQTRLHPEIQIIFPKFNHSLSLKEKKRNYFLPLSLFFVCFCFCLFLNVGLSHRQAFLPGGHQQLQTCLLAKQLQQKENIFKFKQKSQDCLSLVQLRVYAHLLANHIDQVVVYGD